MLAHLVDRRPHQDAVDLATRFLPPPRFADVSFATYRPDPQHPSQQAAVAELQAFAAGNHSPADTSRRWLHRNNKHNQGTAKMARYLDGGFGVGKTHLLASLWHSGPAPKAYLTFGELTAYIGFVGMATAIEVFRNHRLLCIDEFELDDVANTLLVVSFLRGVLDAKDGRGGNNLRLAVTSNTLPDRLGEQRFSASEFRREISAIAAHFDELRIDGEDFRTHATPAVSPTPPAPNSGNSGNGETHDNFATLLPHLRSLHPVQFGPLLDNVSGVTIDGIVPIAEQDDALTFVHFIDKLYDARIPVHIHGCSPDEVFATSYRHGGYRKKYGRAESRMFALSREATLM